MTNPGLVGSWLAPEELASQACLTSVPVCQLCTTPEPPGAFPRVWQISGSSRISASKLRDHRSTYNPT